MTLSTSQADLIIKEHAIHWVFANEVYSSVRASNIEGWSLLENDNIDTCAYEKDGLIIAAFRGTYDFNDVKIDVSISLPGGANEKVHQAKIFMEDLMDEYDCLVQVTGHSLGGDTARQIGRMYGLGIVTFNCAAPPSNPQVKGDNEVHYHIVFDLISAWQDGCVRIDKGYRPKEPSVAIRKAVLMPGSYLAKVIANGLAVKPLAEAHSILAFDNRRRGILINNKTEYTYWTKWFNKLPMTIRITFFAYTKNTRLPILK